MAKTSPDLAAAFETHPDETEVQVGRLERVFRSIGKGARGKNDRA